MSIIAEFSVPAEKFALYETLCEVPEMTVEVERVVAHEADWIVPYFWTSGENYTEFEQVAKDDPSIRELTKLDEVEGANLYRAEWVADVETVAYTMTETGATLLDATGKGGQWRLQLRFDTPEDTTAFQRYLEENELEAELHRLYEPTQPRLDGQPGLTDVQHETLVTALERGYYNTPRDVSMSELATEFGISQQALSKRLRGGHHTLVENSLTVDSSDATDTES